MARPDKAAKVAELGHKFTDSAAVVLTSNPARSCCPRWLAP